MYHQIWAILVLCPVFSGVCRGDGENEVRMKYAEIGENVTIVCPVEVDTEAADIESVKWHRGKFKNQIVNVDYSPRRQPKLRIMESAKGYISADKTGQKLLVLNVSEEKEGIYTCEVTKIDYVVLTYQFLLKLVELPRNAPIITGVKPRYLIGDEVKAECLSEVSKPQSTIEWWINGASVSPDMIINRTTSSTLRFNVSEHLLHGNEQDDMKLMCSVSIQGVYWKTSEEEVTVSLKQTHPSLPGFLPAMFSGIRCSNHSLHLLVLIGVEWLVLMFAR